MERINEEELHAESTLNNEQLDKAVEETVQRIQGLSEGTTTPVEVIEKAFADIGTAIDIKKKSLQELEEEYQQLNDIVSNSLIATGTQNSQSEEEKRAKEHIQKLIEDYGLYYDKRVKLHEQYLKDIAALEKQLEDETEPEKKAVIQTAITNRGTKYQSDLKEAEPKESDYDKLLKDYGTFEQKRLKIQEEYDKKREQAKGNQELIDQLSKSQEKDIQKLSYDELIKSDDYIKLFANLDELSAGKMIELRNNLEDEWRKLNLAPEEFEKIKNKIDGVTKVINDKNPFAALSDAIKGYISNERKVKIKDVAKAAGATFNTVKGSLDEVANLIPSGSINDKINKELVGDISKMVGSAGDVAMGIASGNMSQVIQGSIKFISSAMKVFNSHDRKADREIAKHAETVKDLESKYGELEKAIDKALGSGKYTAAQDTIKNLQDQQAAIAKQAELERGKKKKDEDKVKEYENALEAAKNKQVELINRLRNDIMGIDAKSAAQELGNAFLEAFGKGENAVEAFGKKADSIVSNIIKNMLIRKLLEEPVGNILDRYSQKWYDNEGNFTGFDSVMKDAGQMGKELKGIGPGFAEAMENLPDDIKKYFTGPEDNSGSGGLTGAIKGASEETMNMAAGQLNAMRINQVEANGIRVKANDIMRRQLMHLSRISENTSYLERIYERIARMEHTDSLRSQGLS